METHFQPPLVPMCLCRIPPSVVFNVTNAEMCQNMNGTSIPDECSYTPPYYAPDIFLMSIILFIGTFALILLLRAIKNTPFLPAKVSTFSLI